MSGFPNGRADARCLETRPVSGSIPVRQETQCDEVQYPGQPLHPEDLSTLRRQSPIRPKEEEDSTQYAPGKVDRVAMVPSMTAHPLAREECVEENGDGPTAHVSRQCSARSIAAQVGEGESPDLMLPCTPTPAWVAGADQSQKAEVMAM